jgi:hypothetical protein
MNIWSYGKRKLRLILGQLAHLSLASNGPKSPIFNGFSSFKLLPQIPGRDPGVAQYQVLYRLSNA